MQFVFSGGCMFKLEMKFWNWVEKHMVLFAVLAISFAAAMIRYSFREIESNDACKCLLPWYETIRENGGIHALKTQVGDYNMLYQFIIAVFTYLPIAPLNAYKLLSCIFDFLLAGVMGYAVYDFSERDRVLKGVLAYAVVLFSPIVFFNSSYWAQCDAIYSFFCIVSLLAFCKDKYILAFVMYGIAFAFKLQAVFLLPFYLFFYFAKKKFSFLHFGLIPAVMILLSAPGLVMGRKAAEVFTIYFEQTGSYKRIALNYPTFWNLFQDLFMDKFYLEMKKPAIAITVVVLGLLMFLWASKRVELTQRNIIFMAFLTVYTCVLILPSMHERYGYLYEILAIFVLFLEIRTLPLIIAMYIVSFAIYGTYLFYHTTDMTVLSILNVLTYIGYLYVLSGKMLSRGKPEEELQET